MNDIKDAMYNDDLLVFMKILRSKRYIIRDIKDEELLFHAIKLKNITYLTELLRYGANINETNQRLDTLLTITIEDNNTDMFHKLIALGANVNKTFHLCYSIQYDRKEMIDTLIELSNPFMLGIALHNACIENNTDLFLKLIGYGADIKQCCNRDYYYKNTTPLQHSINNNNETIFQILVDGGVDVSESVGDLPPPLHLVIDKGRIEMFHTLINNGADVNSIYKIPYSTTYTSPLFCAVGETNVEMVNTLLENGANVNYSYGYVDSLMVAVFSNEIEIVKILLKWGIYTDRRNEDGETSIHKCLLQNKMDICRELVLSGADTVSRTDTGKNLIVYARRGRVYDEFMDILDERNKVEKIQGFFKIYKSKNLAHMLRMDPDNLFDPEFSSIRKKKLEIDSSRFKHG